MNQDRIIPRNSVVAAQDGELELVLTGYFMR